MLNPLGVLSPAAASYPASAPASPCPILAARANMSLFVEASLDDLSVLSVAYPASSAVAGSPMPLLDRGGVDLYGVPCGHVVPYPENQLVLVYDSSGAITLIAGPRGGAEHYILALEAFLVSGYNNGSVELQGLLDGSELDRIKYVE